MACNRCSLPCPSDGIECKKWFHYGCTDIPAYFILHLAEIKNFHYICEECVLTVYEDALGRIAKIESSIIKKIKLKPMIKIVILIVIKLVWKKI